MFFTIFTFFALLLILVLVHEAGHFFAARWRGVAVEEFGFGFPPRLFGVRRGKTLYSLNWLPLGGFVRLKGEEGNAQSDPDSFAAQSVRTRGVIIVSGVLMNIVLAFFLLSIGFMIGLPSAVDDLPVSARVRDQSVYIAEIFPDTPAARAGIESGDIIRSVSGEAMQNVSMVQEYIRTHAEEDLHIELQKSDGREVTVFVRPEESTLSEQPSIGVGLVTVGIVSYPWYLVLWKGAQATVALAISIIVSFVVILRDLLFTQTVRGGLAGPVGIAVLTGQVVQLGIPYMLQFAAVLSLNLAWINIFPIPALDGGRFLFLLIEKFRGRPVDASFEQRIHIVGFVFLLVLVFLVTYQDIGRLWMG